jgi:hypothetical protein
MSLRPIIDNPLRVRKANARVLNGDIIITKREDAIGGGKFVSVHSGGVYLGKCNKCPDQCGVCKTVTTKEERPKTGAQLPLFNTKIEYQYVQMVIGSGYESQVSTLAIDDGIAYRAARKNMQIHSTSLNGLHMA